MRKGLRRLGSDVHKRQSKFGQRFLAIVNPGAGLSPSLIASASLTHLPFLLLPLVAVAIAVPLVAVAVALVAIAVTVPLIAVVAVPLVAVAVALIAVVAVSVSGLVVVTVGVRTVAVIRKTKSTGKDELVTAAPIATAPVAAAAECRSASGRHRHVPMAMAATTTPRSSVYWRRG
jgi:hypothetical protein